MKKNNPSPKSPRILVYLSFFQPAGIPQFYLGNHKKAFFRLFCFIFGAGILVILGINDHMSGNLTDRGEIHPPWLAPVEITSIILTLITFFLFFRDIYQLLRGTLKDSDGKRVLTLWEASQPMFKKVLDDSKSRNKKIASNVKKELKPIKEDLAKTKEIWAETKEEIKEVWAESKEEIKEGWTESKEEWQKQKELTEMKKNTDKSKKLSLPLITTQEEFDKLKSGDQYINSDGDHMEKP